jgi:hypothetical protein
MAVMAMMIQLFLSKVAFLSGAALLIAKIALLFSTLVRSQSQFLSMLYAVRCTITHILCINKFSSTDFTDT